MFRVNAGHSPTSVAAKYADNSRFQDLNSTRGKQYYTSNSEDDHTETNLGTIIFPTNDEEGTMSNSVTSSKADGSYITYEDTTFRTLDFSENRTYYTLDGEEEEEEEEEEDAETATYRSTMSLERQLKEFAEKIERQLGFVETFLDKFQCRAGGEIVEGEEKKSLDLNEVFNCKAGLDAVDEIKQKGLETLDEKKILHPGELLQCKAGLDVVSVTTEGRIVLNTSDLFECKAGTNTVDGIEQQLSWDAFPSGTPTGSYEETNPTTFEGRSKSSEKYEKYLKSMQEKAEEQRIRIVSYAADRFSQAADIASTLKEKYTENASPAVKSRVISRLKENEAKNNPERILNEIITRRAELVQRYLDENKPDEMIQHNIPKLSQSLSCQEHNHTLKGVISRRVELVQRFVDENDPDQILRQNHSVTRSPTSASF